MTADLVAANPRGEFLRTVKEQLAPDISDLDLEYFGLAAQRLDLSPFTQPAQIVAIGRWDKKARRTVHRPQVTIDGRLTLAMRSGRVLAIGEGEWCGPSDSKNGKPPVWVGFWDDDQPPHGARSTIWLAGTDVPSRAVVRWKEFAQYNTDGELTGLWPAMPAHMLHKTALALNLRRAVPDILPKDLLLYTEGDAESDPQPVPETHQMVVNRGDKDGDPYLCTCGRVFNTVAAFHAHKTPGPAPAAVTVPPPSRPAGPGTKPTGPPVAGPTYKSRKPARRPVETGPPVDYYDNLPEAQGRA
jgi:hypothetical protein